MKKFIAIVAVAISLTACGGGSTECADCPATTDSTKVDTTVVATVDTTAKADSTVIDTVTVK